MGASVSKRSGGGGGGGARTFATQSLSVTPGQTERAAFHEFMNHPVYLPPPPPPLLGQKATTKKNGAQRRLSSSQAAYAQHLQDPHSPITSSYDHTNNDSQQQRRQQILKQYRREQAILRRQQMQLHNDGEQEREATAAAAGGTAARLKGALPLPGARGDAPSAVARTARHVTRHRKTSGGGARDQVLAPLPPSPSPSSESLGSPMQDHCCCAECCSQAVQHGFFGSATAAAANHEHAHSRAFQIATTGAHDRQQHFPLPIGLELQRRQQAADYEQRLNYDRLQARAADQGNSNIATLDQQEQEYHIPTSLVNSWNSSAATRDKRTTAARWSRRRVRAEQQPQQRPQQERQEGGPESRRAILEEDNASSEPTRQLNGKNHQLNHDNNNDDDDDDEATTCSAQSSSDLHIRQPLATSTNKYVANSSHEKTLSATSTTSQSPLRATTTTTRTTDNNNMASVATSNNLQNNNCKQTDGNSNAQAHKRPSLERGLALDHESRKRHNLLGLLPVAVQDQALQSRAVMNFIDNCKDELSKYVYLRNLKDFNENLFYYTLINNVKRLMPLVYTPTVGLACQKFSEIYMRPRGMFITSNDAGRVRQIIANWPEKDVRVIVVTDGERILGLGDLGANGMGISIGKLSLYTSLAGIPPQNVLPVTIDVGTQNQDNLKDPFYIGLRQQRVRGEKYDALIEEFMQAVVERWGRSCLIQFEDFANATAFDLLKRYRNKYCTFNDDIQGTASVSLSGLISAAKLTGKRLSDCSFLFYGAGEANLGTAQLLIMAMQEDGLKKEEAKQKIWLVDSKGLVVESRQDLSEHKREFAQATQPIKDLESIIDFTKPTAIVGASAQGGSFNESICKKMAAHNERPIIFALSNPTSKAECTAEQAYRWTAGKCVFASGSPFDPVEYNGKTYITGQGNNAYIFPGVGLAAIGAHTHTIPEEAFLVAARALSDQVTRDDTDVGLVYPKLDNIRQVTLKVAGRVLEHLYGERLATYRPEPSDKIDFLRGIQYDPSY